MNHFKSVSAIFPIMIFIALWEITAAYWASPKGNLFPSFTTVITEIYILFKKGIMAQNLLSTLLRVITGLCAGLVSGIIIGTIMGWKDIVNRSLAPVISVLYPIPALGWLPLLMIWTGINEFLPITIISITCFFPICYNTSAGIRNVDREMIRAAHILGASDIKILFTIIFPVAAPHIFAGLKLSSGMAWRVVIAAEMVAIPTGIGALLMKAESLIRVDMIMACLVILSIMCLLFEKSFSFMEKYAAGKWGKHA